MIFAIFFLLSLVLCCEVYRYLLKQRKDIWPVILLYGISGICCFVVFLVIGSTQYDFVFLLPHLLSSLVALIYCYYKKEFWEFFWKYKLRLKGILLFGAAAVYASTVSVQLAFVLISLVYITGFWVDPFSMMSLESTENEAYYLRIWYCLLRLKVQIFMILSFLVAMFLEFVFLEIGKTTIDEIATVVHASVFVLLIFGHMMRKKLRTIALWLHRKCNWMIRTETKNPA